MAFVKSLCGSCASNSNTEENPMCHNWNAKNRVIGDWFKIRADLSCPIAMDRAMRLKDIVCYCSGYSKSCE